MNLEEEISIRMKAILVIAIVLGCTGFGGGFVFGVLVKHNSMIQAVQDDIERQCNEFIEVNYPTAGLMPEFLFNGSDVFKDQENTVKT